MGSILGNTRRPDITFHQNGRIDITAPIAKTLKIGRGDVVDVDYRNGEYLFYVRLRNNEAIGRHEAQCYPTKESSHNLRANSKRLCKAMLAASNAAEEAKLLIGEVVEFPPFGLAISLITRNNISTNDSRD